MAKPEKPPQAQSGDTVEGSYGECFVIMPISDPDEYAAGHFVRVYEDIFKPAIRRAGFEPKRADDVLETNLIQLDLLRRLLEAPMALCDLSSRNPNVLFELGLRQAFDKPVAIVQEEGTPRIFDISPLRFTSYRKARIYHEVLADQEAIAEAITATRKAAADPRNVNSLVRLLGLSEPASIAELKDSERDPAVQLVRAELAELRREIRSALQPTRRSLDPGAAKALSDALPNTAYGLFIALPLDDPALRSFLLALEWYFGIAFHAEAAPEVLATEYPSFVVLSEGIARETLVRAVPIAAKRAGMPAVPRHLIP